MESPVFDVCAITSGSSLVLVSECITYATLTYGHFKDKEESSIREGCFNSDFKLLFTCIVIAVLNCIFFF